MAKPQISKSITNLAEDSSHSIIFSMLLRQNCIWMDINSPRTKQYWKSYLCSLSPRKLSQSKKRLNSNLHTRVSRHSNSCLNSFTNHLSFNQCQAQCQQIWLWPLHSLHLCNCQRALKGKKPTMRFMTLTKPRRTKVWNTLVAMRFKLIMRKSFKLPVELLVPKEPTWRGSSRNAVKVSTRASTLMRSSSLDSEERVVASRKVKIS